MPHWSKNRILGKTTTWAKRKTGKSIMMGNNRSQQQNGQKDKEKSETKVRHNAKKDKVKKCFWHKNKKQKRNDVTVATLIIQQSPGIHFKEWVSTKFVFTNNVKNKWKYLKITTIGQRCWTLGTHSAQTIRASLELFLLSKHFFWL